VMLAPRGYAPCPEIAEGRMIRVGQRILMLPPRP
jgi:phosphatidylserine decarboxylase